MTEVNTQSPCVAQERWRDVLLVDSKHYAKPPRQQRMEVIARIAVAHGVTVAEIMGPSHARKLARARWEAMAAIKAEFGDGPAALGRLFNRDHSSVLHGLRKAAGK